MDSKIVSAEIRAEVRPFLKDQGFSQFTGRSAWRFHTDRVDVVNYQSFNSYNADVIGCTTYSFALNLGTFFGYIRDQFDRNQNNLENPKFRPAEYLCHFRGGLSRSFWQRQLKRRDIWYIDSKGRVLKKAVHDTRVALSRDGMPWFDRLRDPREVLRILKEDDEDMGTCWGFGRNPSPIRNYMLGYVSLHLGNLDDAAIQLNRAIDSGCYKAIEEQIRGDLTNAT